MEIVNTAQDQRNARREPDRFEPYRVGDLVMVHNSRTKRGLSKKLRLDRWRGPYRVIKVVFDVNYRLKMGRQKILAHYDRLKPYHERDTDTDSGDGVDRGDAPDVRDNLTDMPGDRPLGQSQAPEDSVSVDECHRYDNDLLDVPTEAAAEVGAEGPQPGAGMAHEVPVPEPRSPVMRQGGRFWCNVDPQNVLPDRRRQTRNMLPERLRD